MSYLEAFPPEERKLFVVKKPRKRKDDQPPQPTFKLLSAEDYTKITEDVFQRGQAALTEQPYTVLNDVLKKALTSTLAVNNAKDATPEQIFELSPQLYTAAKLMETLYANQFWMRNWVQTYSPEELFTNPAIIHPDRNARKITGLCFSNQTRIEQLDRLGILCNLFAQGEPMKEVQGFGVKSILYTLPSLDMNFFIEEKRIGLASEVRHGFIFTSAAAIENFIK